MKTVSVDREFGAPADRVRSVLGDTTAFSDAAGFDVERDGDQFELTKRVALAQIELDVRIRDDETAALAYEQIAGPFEAMATRYVVDRIPAGSRLVIETSFEPPTTGFGSFLNSVAVRRQRQAELEGVASRLEVSTGSTDQISDGHPIEADGD